LKTVVLSAKVTRFAGGNFVLGTALTRKIPAGRASGFRGEGRSKFPSLAHCFPPADETVTFRAEDTPVTQPPIATPRTDPAPIFEIYRGIFATTLLSAAVAEFKMFDRLANGPRVEAELATELQISPRAGVVLFTALKAMGLLATDSRGRLILTDLSREHLVHGSEFEICAYVSQLADTEAVREMAERLRTSSPAGAKTQEQGVAFIYREGMSSAMEEEATARMHTLALAGRAKNVAPVLAERISLGDAKMLLDVGGGTGIYSIACLKRHPRLRAIVWDRPQVLKVAKEFAEEAGVADRIELRPGDMFADPVPIGCDVILLSNILHDWDVPQCRQIVARLAPTLPRGGRLLIHDAFLNDTMDGPLAVALYSANLFRVTEGRCYSTAEYRGWLAEVGLERGEVIPTLAHCAVLAGLKP
jgi:ubiquinone/menaquinone biosynthesis C-methylase UbiE